MVAGIPQVNSAARVGHFAVRQDLAESYGFAEITDYDTLERFFYAVRQKAGGVIPFAAASNTTNLLAAPTPVANFNAASWDDPRTIALAFTGKGLFFIPARDAARTGSARPVPFWEDDGVVDTFHRIRKYYNDGIINRDALNTDSATITSQWQAGKYASVWAITDGTASNALPALQEAVPGARMANVMPFKDGLNAKPNQTFQADNLVVVPAKGSNVEHALALQDWLSVKANHDLLAYGIEGRDWKAVGEDKYEGLSKYNAAPGFPGYALCWRAGMERQAAYQSESEAEIFAWAQDYDNFTPDPFASFIPDVAPVESAVAQMTSVITEYLAKS
jgi:putative aldouronate transport system substrate-binding protein